jgi:hypothetical protein
VPAAAFLVVAFCIVGGMWFLVNTLAAPLALAFASVSRPRRHLPRPKIRVAAAAAAACAAAGVALFFFGSIMFGVALFERQARYFEPMDWQLFPPCRPVAGFTAPAREVNVSIFRRFVEAGEESKVPFAYLAQRNKNAINYACILRDLSDHSADPSLLEASLDLRYRLLRVSGDFPPIVKAMAVDISYWGDDIRRLLVMAPDRTDVIIPYVSWMMLRGDLNKKAAIEAIDKLSPLAMPDDPVHAWLAASRAQLAGDDALYRSHMAEALRAGLANLQPMRRADTDVFMAAAGPAPAAEGRAAAKAEGRPEEAGR